MNRERATAYLRENQRDVLATLKRDGRPQLLDVAIARMYPLDETQT